MFNLLGGPSHIDMFDLKPDAPAEIRGEFRPIASSVPGVMVCEHLPNLAKLMHKACLIRTFSHEFNSHDPLPFMTGYTDKGFLDQAKETDPPDVGAVCQYLGKGPRTASSGPLPRDAAFRLSHLGIRCALRRRTMPFTCRGGW
jgi:hypothetical protein